MLCTFEFLTMTIFVCNFSFLSTLVFRSFHFVYRHNNTLCKVKGFGHSTTQKMHKYSWIELSGNYVADAQFQLYMLLDNS